MSSLDYTYENLDKVIDRSRFVAPTTRQRGRGTKRRDPCIDRWEAFWGKPAALKVLATSRLLAPTTRRRGRGTKRRNSCIDRWATFRGKPTASRG